jgi:3-hydroxy-9,10-secoandrosta-1,3,5(10)-triene-9,17-dione monooxygenase reductase component
MSAPPAVAPTTSPQSSSRLPAGERQDQRSFREVLGRYPTGVVIIAANTPDGPVGMAVNSFTSVSLDPPLVSFCPMRTSGTWASIRPVGGFAVSTLGADHAEVSRLFARKGADKFAEHPWALSPAGHPVVPGCLGWIDASVEWVAPTGDHELVVARALQWSEPADGRPLVFFGGGYHSLAE